LIQFEPQILQSTLTQSLTSTLQSRTNPFNCGKPTTNTIFLLLRPILAPGKGPYHFIFCTDGVYTPGFNLSTPKKQAKLLQKKKNIYFSTSYRISNLFLFTETKASTDQYLINICG
jgi:hypothetical protein